MKLQDLYKNAVAAGIKNDRRKRKEIEEILREEKDGFKKLGAEEKKYYDRERLANPYADTRILTGDPETDVKKVIVGIDMQATEVLLAYTLNRDRDQSIDLILSHHPEGTALARLSDVMKLQSDLLVQMGVSISVAEQLLDKRIGEIERRLLPVNHGRAVRTAELLGFPMMCIHTPADNCVSNFLQEKFDKEQPHRLKDILDFLIKIPEYKKSAAAQVPPKIVNGSESSRCGKIFVDMTGGTSGSKDIFDSLSGSGVSTIVGMHMGEDYLDKAKKANLNVIIAGHIASDSLGLNLLLDEVEKEEALEFVCISGFERIRRTRSR